MDTVGLFGLGNMGLVLGQRLSAVAPVLGFDPSAERQELARAAGIEIAAAPGDIGRRCEVVVLSLPTPAVSFAMCDELFPLLGRGALIIETSTVLPSHVLSLYGRAQPLGIGFIDAAILSGVGITASGDGALLLGGNDTDLKAAQPYLDAIATRQRHYSSPGAGMAAKVINNAVAHAVFVVLVEAAAIGVAAGLSVAELVDLLRGDDSGLMRPLTHRLGERVATGDYAGGMPTEAARKDSTLALAMAQELAVPLFGIQGAHTVYEIAAKDASLAREDYAAIARLWEDWTSRPFQ